MNRKPLSLFFLIIMLIIKSLGAIGGGISLGGQTVPNSGS